MKLDELRPAAGSSREAYRKAGATDPATGKQPEEGTRARRHAPEAE